MFNLVRMTISHHKNIRLFNIFMAVRFLGRGRVFSAWDGAATSRRFTDISAMNRLVFWPVTIATRAGEVDLAKAGERLEGALGLRLPY
jgi:hypothetical protein